MAEIRYWVYQVNHNAFTRSYFAVCEQNLTIFCVERTHKRATEHIQMLIKRDLKQSGIPFEDDFQQLTVPDCLPEDI